MGSGITIMTGQYDEATKTLKMSGTQSSPATGKDSPIRQETTITGNNTYTQTMYMPGADGKEMKFMEAVFTRRTKIK